MVTNNPEILFWDRVKKETKRSVTAIDKKTKKLSDSKIVKGGPPEAAKSEIKKADGYRRSSSGGGRQICPEG